MAAKPNLDQGNTAAMPRNSPGPLAKTKGHGMDKGYPNAKAKNSPRAQSKNREGQTYRANPTNTPPRDLPHDERIHRELTSSKGRMTGHSRKS